MPEENKEECQKSNWNLPAHKTPIDYEVLGIIKEKSADVILVEFLDSNKFWDETDLFTNGVKPPTMQIHNFAGSDKFKIGDRVLLHVSSKNWDEKYTRDIGSCSWLPVIFETSRVEKATHSPKIMFVNIMQNSFLAFSYSFTVIAILVMLFFLFKEKRKK